MYGNLVVKFVYVLYFMSKLYFTLKFCLHRVISTCVTLGAIQRSCLSLVWVKGTMQQYEAIQELL